VSTLLSVAFLVQILRISVPYVLAALGGTFSERGGVPNIGLEGILLGGAFGFVLGSALTGDPWAGVATGVTAGMLVAAILGIVVIRFGADAIVTGVAVNLLALGTTRFLLKLVWDSASNSGRVEAPVALLAGDGASGAVLGLVSHPLVLLAAALVASSHLVLWRTPFGLRLRACGEHPEAAATAGVAVRRARMAGVLLSGALAGLGGVWLAAEQHQFSDNMSGGRGYIALAAVVFGRWNPLGATLACLVFGAAEGLQISLQGRSTGIPTQFLQMLPYVLTILALLGARRGARAPAALGKSFEG
jgi:general nucleoside transport system permease protein